MPLTRNKFELLLVNFYNEEFLFRSHMFGSIDPDTFDDVSAVLNKFIFEFNGSIQDNLDLFNSQND